MSTTKQTNTTSEYTADVTLPKRRRIFAKAFGIPGFISALISMWFAIYETLVAMTAKSAVAIVVGKVFKFSMSDFIGIPVVALCVLCVMFGIFSLVLCLMSRALGAKTKTNHAGLVLSLVSILSSVSLAVFSVFYMIFA